jgi:diamine N-acetyltransferase
VGENMKITQTTDYEIIAKLNKSVHDLHSKLYPKYFKQYDYEAIKKFFKSIIHNDSFIFLLVEDNGEALGYAWIEIRKYPENAFKKSYKSVYVHQISIAETQRKKGYGSKLMEEIYEIAKNKGIDLVELDYWFENNIAKDFYQKHGFKKYREFVYKEL